MTVVLQVCDSQGDCATDPALVDVHNAPPRAALSGGGTVVPGSTVTFSFSSQSDPSSADTAAGFHYAYACNGGSLSTATYAGSGTAASFTCTFITPGTFIVRARIIDKDGDYTEYTDTVRVNSAPTAAAGPDTTAAAGAGCAATVTLDGMASSDPDGDVLTYAWSEGTTSLGSGATLALTLAKGSHSITLKVTDPSGASSEDVVVVTMKDTTPPNLTAPAAITEYTGTGATSCGKVISDLGTPAVSDNCSSAIPVSVSGIPAGNVFPVGVTTLTYKATDDAGNMSTATQTVTVVDDTPPVVACPSDVTQIAAMAASGATVTYSAATASDNCSGVSVTSSPASGSFFPIGVTTVTVTAKDAAGNTSTCTFAVTILTPQEAAKRLIDSIRGLGPGAPPLGAFVLALAGAQGLTSGEVRSLVAKLEASIQQMDRGNRTAARNQLEAFIHEVNGLVKAGRLPAATGTEWTDSANAIIRSIASAVPAGLSLATNTSCEEEGYYPIVLTIPASIIGSRSFATFAESR